MHVSKFKLGIPNGCCVTKAYVKHVLVVRRHTFTGSVVLGNPARTKFAADNLLVCNWYERGAIKIPRRICHFPCGETSHGNTEKSSEVVRFSYDCFAAWEMSLDYKSTCF